MIYKFWNWEGSYSGMPYVNTRKMLLKAQSEGYAIGAFNIENMEFVQAAIEAAEEMESPIILATSVNTLKYASSNIFSSMVKSTCENSEIPVALHLDHGESYQDVIGVIKSGYLSAMIACVQIHLNSVAILILQIPFLIQLLIWLSFNPDAPCKSYAETPDIYDPKNAAGEARKAVKELIKKKISLFGSEGKAK